MFTYRLHLEDGFDAGEATYSVTIKPGEILLSTGPGSRVRALSLISPSLGEGDWSAAGKPGVVAAKADVREGPCGCDSCRRTHGPAACWSAGAAAAKAGAAAAKAVEASAGARAAVAVAGARAAKAVEASAVAKAVEASEAERRRASTRAVSRPVRPARLEPRPLGPGVALRAGQPPRAEPQRLPTPARRFGLDSARARHRGGLRAAEQGGGSTRRPRQWSR
jgi:hypothetical protein